MEWYCAIRAARQKVLQEKHPDWLSDKVCCGCMCTHICVHHAVCILIGERKFVK